MTESSDGMTEATERPRAVPLARKLAAEAGIDLASVSRRAQPYDPGPETPGASRKRGFGSNPAVIPAHAGSCPRQGNQRWGFDASANQQGELLGDAKSRRIRVATARVLDATALILSSPWRALDLTRLGGGPQSLPQGRELEHHPCCAPTP